MFFGFGSEGFRASRNGRSTGKGEDISSVVCQTVAGGEEDIVDQSESGPEQLGRASRHAQGHAERRAVARRLKGDHPAAFQDAEAEGHGKSQEIEPDLENTDTGRRAEGTPVRQSVEEIPRRENA